MSRLALALLLAAPAAAAPPERLLGRWRVTGVLGSAPITAADEEEASRWVGDALELGPATARFRGRICRASYARRLATRAETERRYKTRLKGLLPPRVETFDAGCTELLMRDRRTLVFAWMGFFLSAVPEGEGPSVIEAGPLRIVVHRSRTADLFHVVDQLSEWSEFSHRQYRRAIPLDDDDRAALARHARLRAAKGWGGDLERTFYVADGLDEALARGVADGRLAPEEAALEKEVLARFAARVDALRGDEAPRLRAFEERLVRDRERLAAFAGPAARFCGAPSVVVPVFLIPNPDARDIGGGYNGGRLTLEIPRERDAYPSLLHELFHALLEPKRQAFLDAAASAPGLDEETLSEGVAYALAPGLFHDGPADQDALAAYVANERAERPDGPFLRFGRLALALRPLLREQLDDPRGTLEAFLPRAVAAWRKLPR